MNFVDKYVNFLNRNKIFIIVFWVLMIVVFGSLFAPTFIKSTSNDFTAPNGTDAAKAYNLVQSYFPNSINNDNHIIVFQRQNGQINLQDLNLFTSKVVANTNNITGFESISGFSIYANTSLNFVKNQFISIDKTVSIIIISIKGDGNYQIQVAQTIRNIVQEFKPKGYNVYVTGQAELSYDTNQSIERDLSHVDIIVIPIVLIALVILLKNWRYLLLTILSISLTAVISFGILDFLIHNFNVTIQSFVPSVLISLILGIGVDYNLFLLTRFREERLLGKTPDEAVFTMMEHAGHTVFTSGLTFTLALSGLAFFPITSLSSVGIAISVGVLLLLGINLTLTPILLNVFGSWFEPTKKVKNKQVTHIHETNNTKGFFYRIGRYATKHNLLIVAVILIITIPPSIQLLNSQPKMQTSLLAPIGSDSSQGFSILQDKFGPGSLGPVEMIVVTKDIWSNKTFTETQLFIEKILQTTSIKPDAIIAPSWINGTAVNSSVATVLMQPASPYYNSLQAKLYRRVITPMVSEKGAFLVSFSLSVDPSSPQAMNTIVHMKTLASQIFDSSYQVGFYGSTANMDSLINSTYSLFPFMILFIIIVIYFFIAIMFKAIFLPVRLIATIGLTLSFIYGMATVVFEYNTFLNSLFPVLNDVSVIFWMVPVMTFSIIIGLGIDYDIFTIERIKEHTWKGYSNEDAITLGISKTAGIITGAGLIMMIAFGGLMFSTSITIIQFGFVLSFGVLLDTFVVRTLLVPALMSFVDKYNWWPNHPPVALDRGIKELSQSEIITRDNESYDTV